MKLKALQTFHVVDLPEFQEDSSYVIEEELAKTLIERGLAEEVKEAAPQKEESKTKKNDLNNE